MCAGTPTKPSASINCAWSSSDGEICPRVIHHNSKFCLGHDPGTKDYSQFLSGLIAEFDDPDVVNLKGWRFPKNGTSAAAFQFRTFEKFVTLKGAVFEGDVSFDSTKFLGDVDFEGVHFEGEVSFSGTKFGDETDATSTVKFDKATFTKPVNFAGAKVFSQISFNNSVLENDFNLNSETEFNAYAYFHGTVLKGEAAFNGVQFKDVTEFDGARFQRGAVFVDAKFLGQTTFDTTVFLELTDFSGAEFRDLVRFKQTHFQRRVTFEGTKFWTGGDANFDRAIFDGTVSFKKTEFHRLTYFTETNFAQETTFEGTEFHASANFVNTIFQDVSFISSKFENAGASKTVTKFEGVRFTRGAFSGTAFSGEFILDHPQFTALTVFERVVFSGGAKFCVQVDERNRLSIRQTDLSSAQFSKSLIENIDFENVEWQSSESYRLRIADEPDIKPFSRLGDEQKTQLAEARRLYRQLRLNYDKSGEYETAGRFYVSESEMSYLLLPPILRWIHPRGLYKWASKYGESLAQATFWLFVLVFLFTLSYWIISQFHPVWFTEPPKMLGTEHSRKLSFLEALWFSVQASKPIADLGLYPGTIFYWLAFAEGIIVPTQIALFLLAIRRRFRRGD